MTDLGRIGIPSDDVNGDLGSVWDCIGEPPQTTSSEFTLSIQESFETQSSFDATARLAGLVPWLPNVGVQVQSEYSLTATVRIENARFVTLGDIAPALVKSQCVQTLCSPQVQYVNKTLVGKIVAVVSAKNKNGAAISATAIAVDSSFERTDQSDASVRLESKEPVTVAVARIPFRTLANERRCMQCGEQGQGCCAGNFSCNGGLGCVNQRCVAAGGRNQPCDENRCYDADLDCQHGVCVQVGRPGLPCKSGRCEEGVCVNSQCEAKCGALGQDCCREACTTGLACQKSLPARKYHLFVGSSIFGVSVDRVVGDASCGPGIEREGDPHTVRVAGAGSCDRQSWLDPGNKNDCRVRVHVGLPSLQGIRCEITAPVRRIAGTCRTP